MKIDILTLFPGIFASVFEESIIKRARDKGLLEINVYNIRDYAEDRHLTVDDYPYGGGPGMVMKADVVGSALQDIKKDDDRVVLMSPQGKIFNQELAGQLAKEEHLLILCGHYEGIDERIHPLIDDEVSVGDYILTGGEIPAMIVVDAVSRLIPGVLGDERSSADESFSDGLLEYPHYTRPRIYQDRGVPEVLLSGHHENIRLWRKRQSILRTLLKRPDLLLKHDFEDEEKRLLQDILFGGEYEEK